MRSWTSIPASQIAGAVVWGARRAADYTVTDASGHYTLTTWTSSGGVEVSAGGLGYSRANASAPFGTSQIPSISLWPVTHLAGRVVDATIGAGVEAALVFAFGERNVR